MSESLGLGIAEAGSIATFLGAVAVVEAIPRGLVHAVTGTVGKVCILPFLDTIEKVVSSVCKLKECKPDKSRPREERAEALAKTMLVFSAAWLLSMHAKVEIRRVLNEAMHIAEARPQLLAEGTPLLKRIGHKALLRHWSPQERMIIVADEAVHYGSLYLLNNQAAGFTDRRIQETQAMLEKVGLSKRQAHDLSVAAWGYEAANIAGVTAGMLAVAGKHTFGWPIKHQSPSFVDLVSGKALSAINLAHN